MSKVRVAGFAISLDGFGAGPDQSLADPLGVGGAKLHEWIYPTRVFQRMFAKDQGTTGIDNDFAERAMANVGAWILGRNMFGPVRGPWPDESWRGWWGPNPPYHVPVYVLTHYPRPSLVMEGGTTFHFIADGVEAALAAAKADAGRKDVRVGGGPATVRAYLERGLIDEMHLVISPMVLGKGEALLTGIDLKDQGFRVTEHVPTAAATHVVLAR